MIKGMIFDVDGTLIDSVDAHAAAWHDTFAEFGVAVATDKIRSQIGKGGDQLMPVFLTGDYLKKNGAAIEKRRGSLFAERYLPSLRAFPRVRELFQRLRDSGVRIALASSAKGDELERYKRLAQIDDLIQTETSSDDAEQSKPHPDIFEAALGRLKDVERPDILVVGDTPYDADAAGKAGLGVVGVLSGGFLKADLQRAGCSNIFRDPADMISRYHELGVE